MELGVLNRLARIGALAGLACGLAVAGSAVAAADGDGGAVTVLSAEVPSNDNFASALFVPLPAGARVAGASSNEDATRQSGEPRHRSLLDTTTVWFCVVPAATGMMAVDTHGSQFDTVLAAYKGATLSSLTRLRLNDDFDRTNPWFHRTSRIFVPVTAGDTIWVVVAGKRGAEGSYRIMFTSPGLPFH